MSDYKKELQILKKLIPNISRMQMCLGSDTNSFYENGNQRIILFFAVSYQLAEENQRLKDVIEILHHKNVFCGLTMCSISPTVDKRAIIFHTDLLSYEG